MLILRQYTLPLLLALLLHVGAVWALFVGWQPEQQISNFVKPQMVKASLILLEAKSKPVAPPKAVQQKTRPSGATGGG